MCDLDGQVILLALCVFFYSLSFSNIYRLTEIKETQNYLYIL